MVEGAHFMASRSSGIRNTSKLKLYEVFRQRTLISAVISINSTILAEYPFPAK